MESASVVAAPWARFSACRGSRIPVVLFLLMVLSASSGQAQDQRTIGFHFGQTRSHQKWDQQLSTSTAKGSSFGVNVDVPTPARLLSIRVGLGYAQRGSQVWDPSVDPEKEAVAGVRSHYLSFAVEGKLRARIGPVAAYAFLGPAIDLLLETQCSQELCSLLLNEKPAVVSAVLGSGVSIFLQDRLRGDFEVRLTESFTDAYRAPSSGVGYRTVELLFRISVPF